MSTLKVCIILIFAIILTKSLAPLINKLVTFRDEKFKFTTTVKSQNINKMTQLEFMYFCKWIFESFPQYKSIFLSGESSNDLVNLTLTDNSNNTVAVLCKRFSLTTNGELITTNSNKNEYVDGYLCKAFVGELIANNITEGIIMTTGGIHIDAMEYINKLKETTSIHIKFVTMSDIIALIEEYREDDDFEISIEF